MSYEGPTALRNAKRDLTSYIKTQRRLALREYQEQWVQSRRDWKVHTRGKEQTDNLVRTDLVQSMSLLVPERGRLAQRMVLDTPISPESKWFAIDDMHSLCSGDLSVLYLPDHQPVEGRCPVKCCQMDLDQ